MGKLTSWVSAVSAGLMLLGTIASCGQSVPKPAQEPKTSAHPDPFGQVNCSASRPQSEPDLMGWDPGSRMSLSALRTQGVVAVRYHAEGCNMELEVLPNCIGEASYEYKPYSATDSKLVRSAQELFTELPLGAAALTGRLKAGQALRADYMLVGMASLPAGSSWKVSSLKGPDCQRATHVVARIYLGGFALASGEASKVQASASFFGVGAGGGNTNETMDMRTEGNADACLKAKDDGKENPLCAVPLRLGLLPLEGSTPVQVPSAPTPKFIAPTPPVETPAPERVETSVVASAEKSRFRIVIFADDSTLGDHAMAALRQLGYPDVSSQGGPNGDINIKWGLAQDPVVNEIVSTLATRLHIPATSFNRMHQFEPSDGDIFINLPIAPIRSAGGRIPSGAIPAVAVPQKAASTPSISPTSGTQSQKSQLTLVVFANDRDFGQQMIDRLRGAGFTNIRAGSSGPNDDFNIKWGVADRTMVEEIVTILAGELRIPASTFRRSHEFAASDTDVFINLPNSGRWVAGQVGSQSIPEACGQSQAQYGPLHVGSTVVLGRHRPVNGIDNWSDGMTRLVGQTAQITRLSGIDNVGCPGVRINLDNGEYFWRIRDMRVR